MLAQTAPRSFPFTTGERRMTRQLPSTAVRAVHARPPELTEAQWEGIVAAAKQSQSPSTRRAYKAAWAAFLAWTDRQGHESLPAAPETVAAYLVQRADTGLSKSTLAIARAAISHQHRDAGLSDPTANDGVRKVLRGLNRKLVQSKGRQKQATGLTAEGLAAIRATATLPRSGPTGRTESEAAAAKRGAIDIALCSVMRDAMLRRSEAAALIWTDVAFRTDGTARVTVRHSKTDQEGEGAVCFVGKDATKALKAIRPDEYDAEARVFGLQSGNAISLRIKKAAEAAGLDGNYSGHSPRVGMTTDLVAAGASLAAVQVAGRWKSARMPGQYARGELAGNGAVARYYGGGNCE